MSCSTPTPVPDTDGDGRWLSLHNKFLAACRENDPDVLFIGDSIVQALQHTETWNDLFVPLHALNFGIHGDKVENVLWRVENGEITGLNVKVIVLHVGTNNVHDTPEDIVAGIFRVVERIQRELPHVYVILPTLLPRGQHPNPLRAHIDKVNELLLKHTPLPRVDTIVIDKDIVQGDGTISHYDMLDYLIPTNQCFRKVFEQVYDLIVPLLISDGNVSDKSDDEQRTT